MSNVRKFDVTPPDLPIPALIFIAVLLTLTGVLAMGWHQLVGSSALWVVIAAALIAPALILITVFRRKVMLDGETLKIVAGLNRTSIPTSSLLTNQARIVDLDTSTEYRLGIKSFGTSMPGYHAGHFRQIGGNKVFALVTDKRRVLVLPERDGRLLMLSLEKPQALLDALQRSAHTQ